VTDAPEVADAAVAADDQAGDDQAGDGQAGDGQGSLRGKAWFWWPWPLLVALDLWSKAAAFGFMEARHPLIPEERRPPYVVFDGAVRFDLVSWGNTGTIWGLFQNGTVVLMVLRCCALVGLLWFVRGTARRARLQLVVLSLVFAGAIGNLYDNFVRDDRSVRDFLHFSGTWPWEWDFPAFNVADSCITVGAIGLFLLLWGEDRAPKKKQVS
jgi:signal peptidase II